MTAQPTPSSAPWNAQTSPFPFADAVFDRAHTLRKSHDALEAAWADPACQVILSWNDQHLCASNGELVRLSAQDPALQGTAQIFLGLLGKAPLFAARLPPSDPQTPPAIHAGGQWQGLRTMGAASPALDAALGATAQSLFGWHKRHAFCGLCGHPTESAEGGHLRQCTNSACGSPHFPRTDPAVIMLVKGQDGRILMGRQAAWPAGMMSTLAGFVEPGETLEQAVAREVFEETGVEVGKVSYVASQPWPFPSSLMLGFMAEATSSAITVDQDELESARWVSREEVLTFRDSVAVEGDGPALPSPISISRRLINLWLHDQQG